MNQEHIEAITTSTKVMYGGAGSAVLFGLTATEIGAYCAIISTLIALWGAWHSKKLKDEKALREREIHQLQVEAIKANRMFMSQHEDEA
jgi:hypothetical protein